MDLKLTREQSLESGIFSSLVDQNEIQIAMCLEHAYAGWPSGPYLPKIPNGTFVCRRGLHQLKGMSQPFETFEITEVPGHTNLLFHAGNFNQDSEGCILLGEAIAKNGSGEMITNSKVTFAKFMELQTGVTTFMLSVS